MTKSIFEQPVLLNFFSCT